MKKKIPTGFLDKGGHMIHDGDTLIVGDDPETHVEYAIFYDSHYKQYRGKFFLRKNFSISKPLEWIHMDGWRR